MGEAIGPTLTAPDWGLARRVLFRFAFAYLIIYNFPFPLQHILRYATWNDTPWGAKILEPYSDLWNKVVPWVGQQVFGVEITVRPNGSGDTTYNYVQVFCFLVLAAAVTAVWSLLDRARPAYPRLDRGLRFYVRFALAAVMITYGSVKVVKSQFPGPTLSRLVEPIGEASPMGILWTFMGVSEPYNLFTGAAEMLGGLLLTTRRTELLGALLSAGFMLNVFVMNMCYDVPVKLFSAHLVAMALFLAAPHAGRLARLFLLNRPVEPVEYPPLTRRRWVRYAVAAVQVAVVLGYVWASLDRADKGRREYGDLAPKPPLHGIWEVEELATDGKDRPPLMTDKARWRRLIIDRRGTAAVQLMDDSRQFYGVTVDPERGELTLKRFNTPDPQSSFTYREPEEGVLTLDGKSDGRATRARLRRIDESKFLLINRGFHWINEYPFNR
jgi:hypothetical protein